MFCPNCRAEYRPGFDRCADCGVQLVAELPAETSSPEEPTAIVAVFGSRGAAEIAATVLDAEGIPWLIQGDDAGGMLPYEAVDKLLNGPVASAAGCSARRRAAPEPRDRPGVHPRSPRRDPPASP